MSKTALLILSVPEKLSKLLPKLQEYAVKTLYINLKMNEPPKITNSVRDKIVELYKTSGTQFPLLDVRILFNELKCSKDVLSNKIDILFLDPKFSNKDISQLMSQRSSNFSSNMNVVVLETTDTNNDEVALDNEEKVEVFDNVVLGGTFDRLHAGHKILLTDALLRCSKRLTVGVTDRNMIKSKKLYELIEPCEVRIEKVKNFLQDVDNTIEHNVVPIPDPFGPTQTDPNLDLIVVSEETLKGGHKVNEVRATNKLKQLEIYCTKLIEDVSQSEEEENKISSSNNRMRLLGTRITDVQINSLIPEKPHLIGLSGGIASGKSSIGKRLKSLGAGHIDCDLIAHKLYEPGTDIYKSIINTFGNKIVAYDGTINRKVLGGIVFSDKNELQKLNALLWPAILERALEESQRLYKEEKKDIVVMEAAVLLQAGWYKYVHEVWTCIISRAEAVKRIMDRNKLSEEDANLRLNSQPTTEEQVQIANVVFSTLWSYEFTRQQVERAWNIVCNEVETSSSKL